MFDNFNHVINASLATLMFMSPGIFEKFYSKDIAKLNKEAQRQAAYIMKSGDIRPLTKIDPLLKKLIMSDEDMSSLEPMMKSMGINPNPDIESLPE